MSRHKVEILVVPFIKQSAKQQAEQILARVNSLYSQGHKSIGLTYSANQSQTETIKSCYEKEQWYTQTSGDNQANVI